MVLQSYDDLTRLEQEIARSLTRQRPSTHLVTFRRGL
jgi:hypothetical protein